MDKASMTIDRHTPIIPQSIWCGLDPVLERIFTKVKNRVILPNSDIKEITKRRVEKVLPKQKKKHITDKMLDEASWAISEQIRPSHGMLGETIERHLFERKISENEAVEHQFCSTAKLVEILNPETVENLSLRIPDKLKDLVNTTNIEGISIPCYYDNIFCGFVTRILNEKLVKYAFSIPNRFCFGTDLEKDEVYVVEGVFDAIAMRSIGHNVIGIGDSQPNYFKMMIASKFKIINLLFDNDYAGWLGSLKAYIILTQMLKIPDGNINILALKDQRDPERLIRDSGQLSFSKITFREAMERVTDLGNPLKDIVL